MPLFEYICRDCAHKFEKLVGKTVPDGSPLCPVCGSDKCERQFSTFASNVRRGSFASCNTSKCGGCHSRFS